MNSKDESHDTMIRAVVGIAHEVKIQLHDAKVIFASVMAGADPQTEIRAFVVRPWGRKTTMTIKFAEVSRVAPVKAMDWQTQRMISAAQMAGVFTGGRHPL
jgi:hypothetical protein